MIHPTQRRSRTKRLRQIVDLQHFHSLLLNQHGSGSSSQPSIPVTGINDSRRGTRTPTTFPRPPTHAGRTDGHTRGLPVTVRGENYRPPIGSFSWPPSIPHRDVLGSAVIAGDPSEDLRRWRCPPHHSECCIRVNQSDSAKPRQDQNLRESQNEPRSVRGICGSLRRDCERCGRRVHLRCVARVQGLFALAFLICRDRGSGFPGCVWSVASARAR